MAADSPQQQADRQAAELARIEATVMAAATGHLIAELDRLTRASAAGTVLSPDAWYVVLRQLRGLADPLAEEAQAAVEAGAATAWAAGLRHAAGLDLPRPPQPVDAGRIVREQMGRAAVLLTSNEQVIPALAVTRRTEHRLAASVTWHVNRAAAAAVDATAAELGMERRWVAERDACLICLALQGVSAAPGQPFRSTGRWLARAVGVDDAPAHPHCRCVVQLHDPADAWALTALKREARRSVLKGWSLPSESEPARLRAADRLLRAGAGLPESVETAARRAVRRGRFRSRAVPTGR